MTTRETKVAQKTKIIFPLRAYLKQLLATNIYVKFLNPWRFWRKCRIEHLETCLKFDEISYLEDCYQLDFLSNRFGESQTLKSDRKTTAKQNGSNQNLSSNIILISQPSFELKYRGITYHKHKIVAVTLDSTKIELNLSISNRSK